jgi:hypothetical protein
MTDPRPLSRDELTRIWRWQRQMFIFYGIAMVLLAFTGVLILLFGDLAWVRRAALAAVLSLIVAATFVQFRERCPRCGLRLGSQGRLFLPEQCRRCSVVFARPPSS